MIVAQVYIDDIIFGDFQEKLVQNFISMVGELSCFLGLHIKLRKEDIFIIQDKYAKNIVKKFGLEKSRQKRTSVATHVKITKDITGESVDHKLYRSMIGSLLYLIASRPDIAYVLVYLLGFNLILVLRI